MVPSGGATSHATISGKVHDAGTITAREHATTEMDQGGCAIIKQRGSAKTLRGPYIFVVRFRRVSLHSALRHFSQTRFACRMQSVC